MFRFENYMMLRLVEEDSMMCRLVKDNMMCRLRFEKDNMMLRLIKNNEEDDMILLVVW